MASLQKILEDLQADHSSLKEEVLDLNEVLDISGISKDADTELRL